MVLLIKKLLPHAVFVFASPQRSVVLGLPSPLTTKANFWMLLSTVCIANLSLGLLAVLM